MFFKFLKSSINVLHSNVLGYFYLKNSKAKTDGVDDVKLIIVTGVIF